MTEGMTEEKMTKIKKGQWYSICCHEDLCQAEEDEEFEDFSVQVFDTREDGLRTIAADWERSGHPDEAKECLQMIKEKSMTCEHPRKWRNAYKRIEGRDYKNAPVVYMKPSGLNMLLNRLAEWITEHGIKRANPYQWNNENYWRFVNDVAKKAVEQIKRDKLL